ncbi:MAG: S-methyl-5-thioribose-1-phosphate isomerase, partial [Planctomycetota bacterium]|nr:S-methyl-5-thioribose-1-phosphate isomerase [Planctomycetota bacterium]
MPASPPLTQPLVPLTLRWEGDVDGSLTLIDQTLLPVELREIECRDVETVWEAIKSLRVRGAPAIGVSAAYGVVIGIQRSLQGTSTELLAKCESVADYLATSRPTAVNLFWALDRMRRKARDVAGNPPLQIASALLAEARAIEAEDRAMCRAIGVAGAALLPNDCGVLTHCNAGGLATADYGTALAVFFSAHEQGKTLRVFADETRPLLQGARLTTWELMRRGLDVTLICDSMAAQVMREGRIQAVVVGADRIAGNGDTANKIGTYSVAILAKHHGIPFYVAAPSSTFDFGIESGREIPIEHRAP